VEFTEKVEELSREYHVTREKVENLMNKISSKLIYQNPLKFISNSQTIYEHTYNITNRYLRMKHHKESKLEMMMKPGSLE
jgi:hypothetical protein